MNTLSSNSSLSLPISIDEKKLLNDLQICLKPQWKEHFNTKDYSGSWTAISLRSQTGKEQDILANNSTLPFVNTPLLEKCNYLREIINQFQCEKETVRLLRLQPDSVIKEHRDLGLAYRFGCFRLHIPIITDASVAFMVGGKNIPMQKGECWYADFDLLHSVKNDSKHERIHLVIDGKRNEWTDALFKKAGYDFELEQQQLQPAYDEATINNIVSSLERINTETSKKMILDLQEKKKNLLKRNTATPTFEISKGYIPTKIINDNTNIKFRWTYVGEKKFTEPFFHETLRACKHFPENNLTLETSAQQLLEESESIDAIYPSAFIFHISRCGSTLLSQMLSTSKECIVLSEVPILDDILRLKYSNQKAYNEEFSDELFKAAIRFYGRRFADNQTHLFIKCDSWHTLFYNQIRRCYPTVPIILLYRLPIEVLRSQNKIPGMQTIPGLIEPSLFDFDSSLIRTMPKDAYFSKVLESYLSAYEKIIEKDSLAFLMSYHDGPMNMLKSIMEHTSFAIDEKTDAAIKKRTLYHSKDEKELFIEKQTEEPHPEYLNNAHKLFKSIEQKRIVIKQ
jgi:hypothetical protein